MSASSAVVFKMSSALSRLCCCCIVTPAVVNVVANWDWCTVAVFTCQSSCSSTSASDPEACQIHMEEVVAVTEAECENQAGLSSSQQAPTAEADITEACANDAE